MSPGPTYLSKPCWACQRPFLHVIRRPAVAGYSLWLVCDNCGAEDEGKPVPPS